MHLPRFFALSLMSSILWCVFACAEAENKPPLNPAAEFQFIKEMKVFWADTELTPIKVWLQGSDLFVYVRDEEMVRHYWEENRKLEAVESDYHERHRRGDNARYRACFSWRLFKDGKLRDPVSKPSGFWEFDSEPFELVKPFAQMDAKSLSLARIGDSLILVPSAYNGGLWKKTIGREPEALMDGYFNNPIAADNGKWILIERRHESGPNSAVLIDMKSLKQHPITPDSTRISPIMYLPFSKRFLLCRTEIPSTSNDNRESDCQYLLLDPETRSIKLVKGEFRPLLQTGIRLLQPTDNRDWYWAAIPDQAKDQTQVGRYNPRTFTFEPLLMIPHLIFDSMAMTVDQHGASLYVIYQEKLFKIPLRSVK
jgi:hypothetical protein